MKLLILMMCLSLSSFASAEIYEIIDKDGHKTYTDVPPPDNPEAKPVTVAPHTENSWQSDSLQQENDIYYADQEKQERVTEEIQKRLEAENNAATAKLDDAVMASEKALEDAQVVRPGDFLPNKKKGMHYSQEYLDRVKEAEEALKKAREAAGK